MIAPTRAADGERETGGSLADASSRIVVHAGPSLRRMDVHSLRSLAETVGRGLELRPPVRRHDLLELAVAAPVQVVMLDGEFGQRLAVSISEIREVLAAGQRLTGAASMGALRAVECRTLGMTGSGWVYEQYLSGAIESDAEVALLYDPDDYTPVTIPLVNLRWLLDEEVREGLLLADMAAAALHVARGLHFRDRRPDVLLRQWKRELSAKAVTVLEPELSSERIDVWDRKRLDAVAAVQIALVSEAGIL